MLPCSASCPRCTRRTCLRFAQHLLANGVKVPPITYPGYMPSGQITLTDPDGYIIGINHWGDAEHAAWLKSIEQEKKSGLLHSSH